jgi:uncharacterized protein (DUF983 family)
MMRGFMADRAADDRTGEGETGGGRLQCPFCGAYQVDRLYIGSLHVDASTCEACGARWDEDAATGRYLGRGGVESVIAPRQL